MLKIYRKMHNVFVMFIILFLYAGCENFDLQESFLDTASNSYTITEYAYRLQGSTTLDVLTLSDTLPLCITWNGTMW